jgi:hypothetical protein
MDWAQVVKACLGSGEEDNQIRLDSRINPEVGIVESPVVARTRGDPGTTSTLKAICGSRSIHDRRPRLSSLMVTTYAAVRDGSIIPASTLRSICKCEGSDATHSLRPPPNRSRRMAIQKSESLWGQPGEAFERLNGRWLIHRSIDHQGFMEGLATFDRRRDGQADYHEEGRLHLAGGTFNAVRNYVYGRLANGFAVFFAETPLRLFHELHLNSGERGSLHGQGHHACEKDVYWTDYEFVPDGRFVIRHRIRGPRKNYTMTTWYERM